MRHPPPQGSDSTRTAEEAAIVELLLLHGWAFDARSEARAAARAKAAAALEGLVRRGLPWRAGAGGVRLFDPTEVLSALAWSNLQRLDPALADACLANGRALAWQTSGGDGPLRSPPPIDPAASRGFRVRLERCFELAGQRGRQRLRLPAPIEDAALEQVEIQVQTPPGVSCEIKPAPARLDILVEAANEPSLTVGLDARFRARPLAPAAAPPPLSPEEADLYTRPSEGLIRVSEAVDALARRLADATPDPAALVRRTWDLLFDEMCCGAIRYEQLDPARPLDWVLEHGWFDCQLGAALIAAVCRARGVPARLIAGYALCAASPFTHYWAEVWLDDRGWTPFDLWGWDLSRGGADAAWREFLFGRLDCRMTTQRLPRLFNGAGSVRLPDTWRILPRAIPGGVETTFFDAVSGAVAYRERVTVEALDERPTDALRP